MDSGINDSNLIYKMLKGHTHRFLEQDDFGTYMDLLKVQDSFMGEKLNPEEKVIDMNLAERAFFDPNNKIAGTFDPSGKLVTVLSGYFYPNFSHWYVYRVHQNSGNISLGTALKNYGLLFTTLKFLMDYSESINRFTYYNKFSLKHQAGWEKGFYLMKQKMGWNMRYEVYWEEIYMPGDTCKSLNHKFFFPEGKETTAFPCVLSMVALKQDIRRESIIKRYGIDTGGDFLT